MRLSGRVRTLRGTVDFPDRSSSDPVNTGKRLIILDDGRINVGYRIIDFRIWNADMIGFVAAFAAQAHLAMSPDITNALPEASDNREIGWAAYNTSSGNIISDFRLVDPDHIVVRDLNLVFPQVDNTGFPVKVNYYILMEEYAITDQEAIISIIKEESQDVSN
tara:strand:- start:305 stop:793 length:489 start_codon:yes stop_codon:yes gene_type:complete